MSGAPEYQSMIPWNLDAACDFHHGANTMGRGVREISRALGCSRRLVREIQRGLKESPEAPRRQSDPLWMLQIDWPAIIHDLELGHPLKFLWEERAH